MLLIVLVGALTFVNVCSHDFGWEDSFFVTCNYSIRKLTNIPSFFTRTYWQAGHPLRGAWYRPLPMVSYAMDYALWGGCAGGFHVTNLLCHLLASVLVYFVCVGLPMKRRVALVAGLVFAVHAVHVEPAVWIKCRQELFAALGVLLSFAAFRGSIRSREQWSAAGCYWWAASLVAAVGAYLSKQNAVVLPAVLSGYVWYARAGITRAHRRAVLAKTAVHWLIAAGLAFWCVLPSRSALASSAAGLRGASQHPDVGTVLATVLTYLRLTLLPIGLSAVRPFRPGASVADITAGAVVVYVAFRVVFASRRSAFWLFWAAVFFTPVAWARFCAGRPIAEQRLYLPSLAFCALVGLGVEAAMQGARRRGRAPTTAVALVLAWLAATAPLAIHHSLAWHDRYAFWSSTVRSAPWHGVPLENLGLVYGDREEWARALRLFLQARDAGPPRAQLSHNIAIALDEQGKASEAERFRQEALDLLSGQH